MNTEPEELSGQEIPNSIITDAGKAKSTFDKGDTIETTVWLKSLEYLFSKLNEQSKHEKDILTNLDNAIKRAIDINNKVANVGKRNSDADAFSKLMSEVMRYTRQLQEHS